MPHQTSHAAQPQALTSENLSRIAAADTSLQRYLQASAESQPYYLPERAPGRENHQQQLKQQMAQIKTLLR